MMNAYRKQGCPLNLLWYKFPRLLKKQVLNRELPIVQAIVDTRRRSRSQRNKGFERCLLNAHFSGYPLIKWATELEMSTEMRQFLIEAGFTHEGTSKISEGPESIISLVINNRKWAFEDVKCLIRKGHDVNKCDRWGELPFHVALGWQRYDIAKLLLLNGAQPLPTNPGHLSYFIYQHFRVETLYLLITYNSLQSVAVGDKTILWHFLKYNSSAQRYLPDYKKNSFTYFR